MPIRPDWDKYAAGICDEIDFWATKIGKIAIPTIFFGGGTPSLMPPAIFSKIMAHIATRFYIPAGAEVTIESNPGTIDANGIRQFAAAGVNRLSVGVQSLDDETLKFLGRIHTGRDAIALLDAARRMNIRTSADFIYATPNQTPDDVVRMCREINAIGLTHVSMYELTIEPGTPFGEMNIKTPDNETTAQMYAAIGATLNIPRYEVSNYSAPGDECRHNMAVWDGAPYIGIGRGAAGRVHINDEWYDQMGANARFEKLSVDARATEMVITGMRTMRGVKLTPDVRRAIDWKWADAHAALVTYDDARMRATPDGILTLDAVLINLIK